MDLLFNKKVDLDDIEKNFEKIEKFRSEVKNIDFINLNFSNTRWFSINSLLSLINVIDYLKEECKYTKIKISLPRNINNENKNESESAKKARDFLRRWKFFEALRFCFGEDSDFFERDQKEYLVEDQTFYLPRKITDESGNLVELFNSRVIEISPLIEKKEDGEKYISQGRINRYIANFAEERIINSLKKGINWGKYLDGSETKVNDVVNYCIREPLENAFDHAEASIGLIAAQKDAKYLIISIIDNGLGIPATIEEIYENLKGQSDEKIIQYAFSPPNKKDVEKVLKGQESKRQNDTKLIEFAYEKGITSKPKTHGGLGLYQLRRFTVGINGFFDVRSRQGFVRFDGRGKKESIMPEQRTNFKGTLITLYLPRKINQDYREGWE
jgi:hypothetical protein